MKGEYNYDIEKFHELGYQILKGVVPTELTDMIISVSSVGTTPFRI